MDLLSRTLPKQWVTLGVFIVLMIILISVNGSQLVLMGMFSYFLLVVGMTLIPIVRMKWEYPIFFHRLIFIMPMYLGWVIFGRHQAPMLEIPAMKIWIFSIMGVAILLFAGRKELAIAFSSLNLAFSISKTKAAQDIVIAVLTVISEEFLFRFFLGNMFHFENYLWTILTVNVLFLVAHYLNRWSTKFTARVYLLQFILGVILSALYFEYHSFVLIVILHFIFNVSQWLPILIRLAKNNVVTF
ncbi:CPBP family intramembrane glutamic endopeptidase [Leuconostoc sp. MS02]|uniref:CPBP family intramembrane glutamic endopeptidase n=1 Tax=Leuconostoc aquikimchii TaxID=3236804 RepID=A0ABV3S7C4_9LACO